MARRIQFHQVTLHRQHTAAGLSTLSAEQKEVPMFDFPPLPVTALSMEQDPAFVLLDLNMPRVSGFDVLATVRESERLRHIPIIALTGSAQKRDIAHTHDSGVIGYVVKPVEFGDLIQAAKAIIGMWARHNETPPRFRSPEQARA